MTRKTEPHKACVCFCLCVLNHYFTCGHKLRVTFLKLDSMGSYTVILTVKSHLINVSTVVNYALTAISFMKDVFLHFTWLNLNF